MRYGLSSGARCAAQRGNVAPTDRRVARHQAVGDDIQLEHDGPSEKVACVEQRMHNRQPAKAGAKH
mgnify:CR=1 FL=1